MGQTSEESGELGLQVADLSAERAQQFGLDPDEKGVLVVDVENASRAARADVRVGDIIKGVNRNKVKDLESYRELINRIDTKKEVLMLILRRNEGLKAVKIDP